MRECRKAKKLLSRYIDKETNSMDAVFVKEHLETCQICNKEYAELCKVKQLMLDKVRKSLPADYLVCRLQEQIARQSCAEERFSWIAGMGDLSRRLIPIPTAIIVLSLLFLIFSSGQPENGDSLTEQLLTGEQATTETAVRLILGTQN